MKSLQNDWFSVKNLSQTSEIQFHALFYFWLWFDHELIDFLIPGDSLDNASVHSMAIRVVEFSNGGTKLEIFFPKNQHTQRKLLNFENWVNREVSKSAKIWLSKSIFYVKNDPNLSQFFFLKINILKGNYWILRIGLMGRCQESPKFDI